MMTETETGLNKLLRHTLKIAVLATASLWLWSMGNVCAAVRPTDALIAAADTIRPDTLPDGLPSEGDASSPTVSGIPNDSCTAAIVSRLQELVDNAVFDRTQLGLYVYDLTADAPVFARGEQQQLRPASCEKILTSVAALRTLGTDFRYRTSLYADGQVEDSTFNGTLYLRGGFDPLFDRTDLVAIVDSLSAAGIRRINGRVVFDRSLKDTSTRGWGWCWDDKVTALTPLLYEGREGLERRFFSALRDAGFEVNDDTEYRETPRSARLLAERTHNIDQVLLPILKNSDNLFAESLFYQLAAESGHAFADHKRAARVVEKMLSAAGVAGDTYRVADGSGLSLYNYLTPRVLVATLRYAYRHDAIYRHLLPALPVAGADGTLRKRMTSGNARGNVRAKTGTVEGVSSLAGYCTAANGHTLCFAIINQGILHTATGRNFQDRVCRALAGD